MMTFETWKEMTEGKPHRAPFVLLFPTQQLTSETARRRDAGQGSTPHEAASKEPSACGAGCCRFIGWHGFTWRTYEARPSHEMIMTLIQTLPSSLANPIAVVVCLFSIIHKAVFEPPCQLSQKHISGFTGAFIGTPGSCSIKVTN